MIDLCCTLFLDDTEAGSEKADSEPEFDDFRENALKLLEKLHIQIEERDLQQPLRNQKITIRLRKKLWHTDASLN